MNNIILSVQPKWAAKILNGEKTDEIRKTIPQCLKRGEPVTVWMYETVGKTRHIPFDIDNRAWGNSNYTLWYSSDQTDIHNGKRTVHEGRGQVVAKFVVEKVTKSTEIDLFDEERIDNLLRRSRLTLQEIIDYAHGYFYAWHISSLEIVKPMELKEFQSAKSSYDEILEESETVMVPLTRAPQSWQYVIPPSVTK